MGLLLSVEAREEEIHKKKLLPAQKCSGAASLFHGDFRIVGVSEKDEGIYHCVASSYQGEVISDPATIQVQIPGGWSEWMPWQPCSATCGRGVQMR
ncbi:Hemicentin-1 [Taenia solium]|eukprot:TsM_000627500 transcript=TsM_000627500 gene=TsM_000627500